MQLQAYPVIVFSCQWKWRIPFGYGGRKALNLLGNGEFPSAYFMKSLRVRKLHGKA